MYYFSLRKAPAGSFSDSESKLKQLARLVEYLKEKMMMGAPLHTHAIMALDLLCTLDPLSECTVVSQSAYSDSSEHTKKRKRDQTNTQTSFGGYRARRGESLMCQYMCQSLQSTETSSNSDLKSVLSESVQVNSLHLTKGYREKSKVDLNDKLPARLSPNREQYRVIGTAILKYRHKLQANILDMKDWALDSSTLRMNGMINDDEYASMLDESASLATLYLESARLVWEEEQLHCKHASRETS